MKHLAALNKYFWKYRWRFFLGIIFVLLSNYFKILQPQVTRFVVDAVAKSMPGYSGKYGSDNYDPLIRGLIHKAAGLSFGEKIVWCGIILLVLALISGFFLFLMRQTIIVMSRFIEFEQKNEVYRHYQLLDTNFYKQNSTGDLMNRITEDVSRVRMYTGPALMYFINLAFSIGFCLFYMLKENWELTLYVLSPLPLLAVTIYFVNNIIHKKSEKIQSLLSDLTTAAQESYSGIRVIKSFVQEEGMQAYFMKNSEAYRKEAVGLAKMEAIYFPTMGLMIGISTLLTIMIGGIYAINGDGTVTTGTIAEFVMYINILTFPVSAIGWTASMIQRAAASQKRLNEFLDIVPDIRDPLNPVKANSEGEIVFENVSFTYPHTGIKAVVNFDLHIRKGDKIAIIGRAGSGKTTIAQLLLRMYDPVEGRVLMAGTDIRNMSLAQLREQVSYTPQDVFLFSDSIANNIRFGLDKAGMDQVKRAAEFASVDKEIQSLPEQYETIIGERGVTLSGGQKQRISIARALIKNPQVVVFDDCLSAVDAKTEREIIGNLYRFLENRTSIIITHRIFSLFDFDKIVVLDEGRIVEQGTHRDLIARDGYYAYLYGQQQLEKAGEETT